MPLTWQICTKVQQLMWYCGQVTGVLAHYTVFDVGLTDPTHHLLMIALLVGITLHPPLAAADAPPSSPFLHMDQWDDTKIKSR